MDKITNQELNRICKKIKRYLFYEKKITQKLDIKNHEAIVLFFKDQNIACSDKDRKNHLLHLHHNKKNEILNTRTYRAPRDRDDWRKLHKDYLRTEKWKEKRNQLFNLRGKRCEHCQTTKRLHVHHKHYDTFMNERMEDLTVLCKSCHEAEHKRWDEDKEKKKIISPPQMTRNPKKIVKMINNAPRRVKRNGVIIDSE